MTNSVALIKKNIWTVAGLRIIAGSVIVAFYILVALLAPWLAPYSATKPGVGKALSTPSAAHLFGATYLGYDLMSRAIYGTRTALEIVLMATVAAVLIGVPLGLISGYLGGWFDRVMVLVMDSVYSFPGLILAIIVAAMIGAGMLNAAISVSVVYIPQYYRVTRNQTLSVREQTFVEAARAIGSSGFDTILRYILPNVSQSIPVIVTLNSADAVLTLAGLSFLGFGLTPPHPSWGLDISTASNYLTMANSYPEIWWWATVPGVAIILLIVGFTLLGTGLNDILNPQIREGSE